MVTDLVRTGVDPGIPDSKTPPFPTGSPPRSQTFLPETRSSAAYPKSVASSRQQGGAQTSLPTEARLRQKERLTDLKEKGLKPKTRPKEVEPGNDDCGDDLSGLGKDIVMLGCDYCQENLDDDAEVHFQVPNFIPDGTANVFSAIASLCYGRNNSVDLLELCGGEGRISQVAFSRGLKSGGNLDLVTGCDLGSPEAQKAIHHYLKT